MYLALKVNRFISAKSYFFNSGMQGLSRLLVYVFFTSGGVKWRMVGGLRLSVELVQGNIVGMSLS